MKGQTILKPCPACNGQVSEHAESCPHCGHPLPGRMASAFGSDQRGQTVRPDWHHDPNVGALGCLLIILAFVVIARLQGC